MVEDKAMPNQERDPDQEQSQTSNNETMLRELKERRERGDISAERYDPNLLFQINEMGNSLRRSDLEPQLGERIAVELPSGEFATLGYLRITLKTGQPIVLDSDDFPSGNTLIIYPEDLGNKEDEDAWKQSGSH